MTAIASHLTADFVGVLDEQLRDSALLSGLLIAAAGAAGFSAIGLPTVRARDAGIGAALMLDGCHITAHTFPAREILLLDVLAPTDADTKRAFEVFARRLTAREVRSKTVQRG